MGTHLLLGVVLSIISFSAFADQGVDYPKDSQGRRLIQGPVGPGTYFNVHIISNSVGVFGDNVKVINSFIEAPVCIRVGGISNQISNNILKCNLCVQFTGDTLIDNTLNNNNCSGRGTNRPDVFGW